MYFTFETNKILELTHQPIQSKKDEAGETDQKLENFEIFFTCDNTEFSKMELKIEGRLIPDDKLLDKIDHRTSYGFFFQNDFGTFTMGEKSHQGIKLSSSSVIKKRKEGGSTGIKRSDFYMRKLQIGEGLPYSVDDTTTYLDRTSKGHLRIFHVYISPYDDSKSVRVHMEDFFLCEITEAMFQGNCQYLSLVDKQDVVCFFSSSKGSNFNHILLNSHSESLNDVYGFRIKYTYFDQLNMEDFDLDGSKMRCDDFGAGTEFQEILHDHECVIATIKKRIDMKTVLDKKVTIGIIQFVKQQNGNEGDKKVEQINLTINFDPNQEVSASLKQKNIIDNRGQWSLKAVNFGTYQSIDQSGDVNSEELGQNHLAKVKDQVMASVVVTSKYVNDTTTFFVKVYRYKISNYLITQNGERNILIKEPFDEPLEFKLYLRKADLSDNTKETLQQYIKQEIIFFKNYIVHITGFKSFHTAYNGIYFQIYNNDENSHIKYTLVEPYHTKQPYISCIYQSESIKLLSVITLDSEGNFELYVLDLEPTAAYVKRIKIYRALPLKDYEKKYSYCLIKNAGLTMMLDGSLRFEVIFNDDYSTDYFGDYFEILAATNSNNVFVGKNETETPGLIDIEQTITTDSNQSFKLYSQIEIVENYSKFEVKLPSQLSNIYDVQTDYSVYINHLLDVKGFLLKAESIPRLPQYQNKHFKVVQTFEETNPYSRMLENFSAFFKATSIELVEVRYHGDNIFFFARLKQKVYYSIFHIHLVKDELNVNPTLICKLKYLPIAWTVFDMDGAMGVTFYQTTIRNAGFSTTMALHFYYWKPSEEVYEEILWTDKRVSFDLIFPFHHKSGTKDGKINMITQRNSSPKNDQDVQGNSLNQDQNVDWLFLYTLESNYQEGRASLIHFVLKVTTNSDSGYALQLLDYKDKFNLEFDTWLVGCDSIGIYEVKPLKQTLQNSKNDKENNEFLEEVQYTEENKIYDVQIMSSCQLFQKKKIYTYTTRFNLSKFFFEKQKQDNSFLDGFGLKRITWNKYEVGLYLEDIDKAAKANDEDNRVINGDVGHLMSKTLILDKPSLLNDPNEFNLSTDGTIEILNMRLMLFKKQLGPFRYIYTCKLTDKIQQSNLQYRLKNIPTSLALQESQISENQFILSVQVNTAQNRQQKWEIQDGQNYIYYLMVYNFEEKAFEKDKNLHTPTGMKQYKKKIHVNEDGFGQIYKRDSSGDYKKSKVHTDDSIKVFMSQMDTNLEVNDVTVSIKGPKLIIFKDSKQKIYPSKDSVGLYYLNLSSEPEKIPLIYSLDKLVNTPLVNPNQKFWILIFLVVGFGFAVALLTIVILARRLKAHGVDSDLKNSGLLRKFDDDFGSLDNHDRDRTFGSVEKNDSDTFE